MKYFIALLAFGLFMSLRCQLFGHKPPVYSRRGWWSPGNEYANPPHSIQIDGTGRVHAVIDGECARCGRTVRLCRIHLPTIRTAKVHGYWEILPENRKP